MPSASLPILTYHSIDDSGSVISIAPALFRQQMAYLAEYGWQTLTLSEAVRHLASGRPTPPDAVVLTFDDGFENVYTEAFPVLERYGFRATVFLITDYCGGAIDGYGPSAATGRLPVMDWPAIAEMHAYGVEFGAHTLTHPDLTRLSPQAAEHEMVTSKTVIQDRLGTTVDVFAYPYGSFNGAVKAIARRHFLSAVSTRLGRARPRADLHALCRMDMYYLQPPWFFKNLSSDVLAAYLRTRQLVRDVKEAVGVGPGKAA